MPIIKTLKNGAWTPVNSVSTISTATSSVNGLMSSSDKDKLDSIPNTVATTSANGLMSATDKTNLDTLSSHFQVLYNGYIGYTSSAISLTLANDNPKALYLVTLCGSDGNGYPNGTYFNGIAFYNTVYALYNNNYCTVAKSTGTLTISPSSTSAYVFAYVVRIA